LQPSQSNARPAKIKAYQDWQITHLRLNQDQINEKHDEVMLDIFVGEAFASRTLG
jgi:hypothetical protein